MEVKFAQNYLKFNLAMWPRARTLWTVWSPNGLNGPRALPHVGEGFRIELVLLPLQYLPFLLCA